MTMDRDKLKEIAEGKMDAAIADALLVFEQDMCRIWETNNHCKKQKLRLIVDYKILSKTKIEMQTQINVIL